MEFLTLSSFQLKISSTNLHLHPPYGDFKILNNEGGGGGGVVKQFTHYWVGTAQWWVGGGLKIEG